MSSLGDLYTHLKTLCEQWFYNKSTIDGYLNNKISKSSTVGLVKNDGSIDTTSYSTFNGNYNSLSNKPTIPSKTSDLTNDSDFITSSSLPTKTSDLVNDGEDGTNAFIDESDSRLTDARTPTSHTHGNIQDGGYINRAISVQTDGIPIVQTNNQLYSADNGIKSDLIRNLDALSNIGASKYATQRTINSAIDTAIGNLTGLQAYEVTSDKGTASASTMGKLYIEVGSNTTDVYYTVEDNGSYSWESLDTDILDNLSIDWDDVANKPSLFSGSYNDLSDKPSTFTPSSHTHGNISNDGKCPASTDNTASLSPNNMPLVARASDSLIVRSILDAYVIVDPVEHTNIGSSANARQRNINSLIDTALGGKVSSSDLGSVAFSNSYNDLDDLPTLFSGDYDDLINKPNIPSGIVVDTTLNSSSNNAIANSTVTTALNGKVDTNDSRLSDARTPTSHTHGYIQNDGTLTQTGTNNGSIVVTNSSNKIVIQSSIDVLDGLVQDLITYGSS